MTGSDIPWVPIWRESKPDDPFDSDVVCQHGTAADVHCCNYHHGFLFDTNECECELIDDDDEAEDGT